MTPENLTVAYLNGLLPDGITASTDTPAERPERFVTVERVGGSETRHIARPMLAVQSWARSTTDAGGLDMLVRRLLELMPLRVPEVALVTVESTVNDPLDDAHPRYQTTITLTIHKTLERQP